MLRKKPMRRVKQSDCNILLDNAKDSFGMLEKCFNDAFDESKTKINVVGSMFGFGASITKLAFNTTGCAIKNAPKAVVAVAAFKQEALREIENGVNQYKRKQREEFLNEKIIQLAFKK